MSEANHPIGIFVVVETYGGKTMSGEINKTLKKELLPVSIPGGEAPKVGTVFGEITKTPKTVDQLNLEAMKAAQKK
jgi:hypothetical protein